MPLWFFPALLGLFAIISLGAGLWLLLHMRDVVRMVSGRHDGELVPGPGRRRAPPSAVWLALAKSAPMRSEREAAQSMLCDDLPGPP